LTVAELGLPGLVIWGSILYLTVKTPLTAVRRYAKVPEANVAYTWGMALLAGAAVLLVGLITLILAGADLRALLLPLGAFWLGSTVVFVLFGIHVTRRDVLVPLRMLSDEADRLAAAVPGTPLPAAGTYEHVAAIPIDHDGRDTITATVRIPDGVGNRFEVIKVATGDGRLQAGTQGIALLTWGDINRDGYPDATVRDICDTAAGFVSGIRVPDEGRDELRLIFRGEEQPPDARAQDVGIGWLDYVEIKVGS
jgi:hypothetical protein